jgi:DNA primase
MRIKKETIDQIYNSIDIVEVVGDFVSLKKRGANYAGLSPFTNEKTPSFYVSSAKQIFKCFSTSKGGDAVKFLMEVDNLTYVEALKYLAKKYSIEIQYERTATDEEMQQQSDKDALFIVLNYAKDYYRQILFENPMGQAVGMSYFKERGLNEKTINDFELGFALDGWDNLLKDAKSKLHSEEILEKAGLIKVQESGKKFDFFRNRVMYPIHNMSGKVVALAGRILNNEKGIAKYINSPETELYHKSKVLYGLFQAKNAIRTEENCLLVEGYMDVISLYQAGIMNAVASSGTSLTEEQVKLISRYTKNVTVLYDGDTAGIKAAIRGTDLILDSGLNIKVLVFPNGHDPDSYVQEVGETAFKEFLKKNAIDFITFKTEILLKDASNDPIKKSEVIHEVVNSIAKVKDNIQRSVYFKKCSQLLDIDEQIIISEYNKIQLSNRKKEVAEAEKKQSQEYSNSDPDFPAENTITEFGEYNELQNAQPLFSSINPYELAEREIVRILIEYSQLAIDENQTPLYKSLFEILTTNNLQFEHSLYSRIIDIFRIETESGNTPNLGYFLNHPDKEIEQCLMEIITDKYELSKSWEELYSVFIPGKDQDKFSLLTKSIIRFQFEKTRNLIRENQNKLMKIDFHNLEEEAYLLESQKQLKIFQMQCAGQLGMVVSG